MSRTFQRAGGALLIALAFTGAAQAQFHNLYFVGNQPNNLTSVIRTLDGGYIATENLQGGAHLVKLQAGGQVQAVRRYGPPTAPLHAVQVRQNKSALYKFSYVWTGHRFQHGQPLEPFLLSVNPATWEVNWGQKILFPVPAQATALEIDKTNNNYWIGGTAEPGAAAEAPWIARFTAGGGFGCVKRFQFPQGAQLHSLIPTDDGGAIGVGQLKENIGVVGAQILKPRMLAFKVTRDCDISPWVFRYNVEGAETASSEQWLADIIRSGTTLFVTGTITNLCTPPLSSPCTPRPSTIFTAILNEATGALTKTHVIFPKDGAPVGANTLAGAPDYIGIGGWLRVGTDEQALLLKTDIGALLQGMLYGDGSGPYRSAVLDVANPSTGTQIVPGFVFVTRQASVNNIQRPAIVRTDQNLSAFHGCEFPVPLDMVSVAVKRKAQPPLPKSAEHVPFSPPKYETNIEPTPCTQLPPVTAIP